MHSGQICGVGNNGRVAGPALKRLQACRRNAGGGRAGRPEGGSPAGCVPACRSRSAEAAVGPRRGQEGGKGERAPWSLPSSLTASSGSSASAACREGAMARPGGGCSRSGDAWNSKGGARGSRRARGSRSLRCRAVEAGAARGKREEAGRRVGAEGGAYSAAHLPKAPHTRALKGGTHGGASNPALPAAALPPSWPTRPCSVWTSLACAPCLHCRPLLHGWC